MDTRLRNVIDSWHCFTECERNIIFHKAIMSFAMRVERRWWLLRDQDAIIIGVNTLHIIGE